ncbi:hypothetical protein CYMTET_54761 [Cymbomonas tetramitiformis]|uniref:Uncharacterized protein n=1 Tax=Cymbomonas tetramitiformis TaxID=36881 RepID=A0AAE0ENF0_9CHLO|nr:hypothetical protein CYMTET_54761 [Cymbomonas tetramitiformis]
MRAASMLRAFEGTLRKSAAPRVMISATIGAALLSTTLLLPMCASTPLENNEDYVRCVHKILVPEQEAGEYEEDETCRRLYLNHAEAEGTIPSELGKLYDLEYLDAGENALSGTIPTELGDLRSLTYLDLEANNLGGSIPTELGNLENLNHLILSANDITGAIPTELGSLKMLMYL